MKVVLWSLLYEGEGRSWRSAYWDFVEAVILWMKIIMSRAEVRLEKSFYGRGRFTTRVVP